MQINHPVLLSHLSVGAAGVEGAKGRGKMLAKVQGHVGRVLQACSLEDSPVRVLGTKEGEERSIRDDPLGG